MGLVLRVFFSQSRVDLVQTEDTARIELAEAAGRLKVELSSAVVSMNDFSRQTRQALQDPLQGGLPLGRGPGGQGLAQVNHVPGSPSYIAAISLQYKQFFRRGPVRQYPVISR